MLGLQPSVGMLSDISRRLIPTIMFHGIKVQGIRVAGSEIPDNKRLAVALQSVYGIGRSRARLLLAELGIVNKLTRELTGRELVALREHISSTYVTGDDLRRLAQADITRMKSIQCYRGIRHEDKLPCRGQRTKTNCQTAKKGLNYVTDRQKVSNV